MSRRVAPALMCAGLILMMVVSLGIASEPEIPLPEGAVARLGLGRISDVTYSPDGRYLAVATSIGFELRNAESLELVRFFRGHTGLVHSVAFSPDGRTLASGSSDCTVKLWNVATGEVLRTLNDHTDYVRSVAFSPDGRTLASASYDKMIKLWDVGTGEVLRTLNGHTDYVLSVAFNPDGAALASGSYDGTVLVFDLEHGSLIPDENLAKAIRNILGKPPEERIYRSDLESMEELLVPLQEIRDLAGLQYAVNLRRLDLWSNEITDISALTELPNLTWVDLQENLLDLSPGSKAMEVIQVLLDRGVAVDY